MKKIIIASLIVILGLNLVTVALATDGLTPASRVMLNYSEDANTGKPFVLDGSKSQDDEVVKTFTWTQVGGPKVPLSDANAAKPTFTPTVAGTYVFELTVTDNTGLSSVAQKVTVYAKGESSGSSTERVLPTVNKAEDDEKGEIKADDKNDDDNDGSSARVLPTVNKKTGAKVTVRGWDDEKKETVQKTVDAEVENDMAIRSVEISEDAVAITYATPAKLLGFINITMNLDIHSDADGKVKVRFPWYRFMAKTDFSDIQEKLDYVFQNNETDFEFLKTKGSVKAQIEIFSTISKTMHDMAKSIIQNIRA